MGFEININTIWQSFVIILLPSPIFQIFFLQSKPYRTAFLGEMGGWCFIWVGRLIGVRQKLERRFIPWNHVRTITNVSFLLFFLSVDRIIFYLSSPLPKQSLKVQLTPKIFFAKIIRLSCGVIWRKTFLIWLNPRIFMPRQNRLSNGSRPRMGNLGRVKAVTSNRERTLWLSQSGLLFCMSVGAILPHKLFA